MFKATQNEVEWDTLDCVCEQEGVCVQRIEELHHIQEANKSHHVKIPRQHNTHTFKPQTHTFKPQTHTFKPNPLIQVMLDSPAKEFRVLLACITSMSCKRSWFSPSMAEVGGVAVTRLVRNKSSNVSTILLHKKK